MKHASAFKIPNLNLRFEVCDLILEFEGFRSDLLLSISFAKKRIE